MNIENTFFRCSLLYTSSKIPSTEISKMKLAKGLYKTAKAGVIGSTDIEIMVCFPSSAALRFQIAWRERGRERERNLPVPLLVGDVKAAYRLRENMLG